MENEKKAHFVNLKRKHSENFGNISYPYCYLAELCFKIFIRSIAAFIKNKL